MKTLTFLLFVVCFTPGARAQYDLGQPGGATPYDRFMGPVRSLLARLGPRHPDAIEVRQYMRTGRSFRYAVVDPVNPQTPEMTERLRSGDCKAKSFWLVSKMRDGSARFVIGKMRANSKVNHAWVLWQSGGVLYVLDPTIRSDFVSAEKAGPRSWVPLYSYQGNRIYRHSAIATYGENWENPPPIVGFPETFKKSAQSGKRPPAKNSGPRGVLNPAARRR